MAIIPELEANIARYYYVKKWHVGIIARQLSVHHTTVKRVLSQVGVPRAQLIKQASIIDPFLPFVIETVEKFSKLTTSRLYAMVRERGYNGDLDHFRHMVALHRPKPKAEAYLRLRTLPGEQAQVDWGHFGYITIGKAQRPIMAFVKIMHHRLKHYNNYASISTEPVVVKVDMSHCYLCKGPVSKIFKTVSKVV